DVLVKTAALPRLRPGDLLGIGMSGAYGASASPGIFLSHCYPAAVLVRDGRAELVAEADTTERILGRQRLASIATQPDGPAGPAGSPSTPSASLHPIVSEART